MTSEHDDLLRAKTPRCDYAAESDGAIADDNHRLARTHFGRECGVMSRTHHIRERQQRGHERVVATDG